MRRGYSDDEAAGLLDLFGPRERWATTLRTFQWLQTTAMVQGFTGATQVNLPLECTYDFEVAASKYLHALRDGTVPLQFLFSGTIFSKGPRGFAVQQVPWDREDRFDMPVSVWRDLMQQHYPNTGWLRLDRTRSTRWPPTVRRAVCCPSTRRSPRCWTPVRRRRSDDRELGRC